MAVAEQAVLKKTARDIFVDFATNVTIIKMPSEQFGQGSLLSAIIFFFEKINPEWIS